MSSYCALLTLAYVFPRLLWLQSWWRRYCPLFEIFVLLYLSLSLLCDQIVLLIGVPREYVGPVYFACSHHLVDVGGFLLRFSVFVLHLKNVGFVRIIVP